MPLLHVTQLFAGAVAGSPAWHEVYTVPSGYRAKLTSLWVQNLRGAAQDLYVGLSDHTFLYRTLGSVASQDFPFNMVFLAGDQLSIYNDHTLGFYVVASGYIYYV